MTKNESLNKVKVVLEKLATKLGVDPTEVTVTQFLTNQTELTEWNLRKLGGLSAIQSTLWPESKFSDSEEYGTKFVKAFVNKLNKKHGIDEYLKDEFITEFKAAVKDIGLKVYPTKKKKKKSKISRTIVAHVSDTHFGANIQGDEMANVNEFNWNIAARRMGLFAEQIVNFKPQHRKNTELVIAINGDIICGMIHDQEWFADLLTKQVAGTIKILTQFISYCAGFFGDVRVVMTTGNHGRSMHKSNKSRATTHKWDSYETCIYLGVKYAIEAKCKNVKCFIPQTPYAVVDIQGHKFLQTHGDTVLNVGNPGRSINMKSINTQINSINASTLSDVVFAGMMVGHVHVNTVQITDNGTVLIINGTLSGADPFCQSIGIFGNQPSQTLFEVTKEFAVGDIRLIRLEEADHRADLEKIIEPLKKDLE